MLLNSLKPLLSLLLDKLSLLHLHKCVCHHPNGRGKCSNLSSNIWCVPLCLRSWRCCSSCTRATGLVVVSTSEKCDIWKNELRIRRVILRELITV
ncbi:hypothetical protein GQ55_4G210600 [Panicum hallii var. hallii]|uniref:Secreted protein n=1 Tax=Panicum hallii var. hallii TaxID=1504633 RepID=A0A2T7DZA0_9POAL|nr:hypothetical protein GQ55_4G210600 [Panicum hallii var. hallii]